MWRRVVAWGVLVGWLLMPSAEVQAVHCDGLWTAQSCHTTEAACDEAERCREGVLQDWTMERCTSASDPQGSIQAACEECNKACLDWMNGIWTGEGDQHGDVVEHWTMRLIADRSADSFKIQYLSLNCGGTLTLNYIDADSASFTETITYDKENQCVDGGTVTLRRRGATEAQYHWSSDDESEGTATGTLTKSP